ncbi:hypothetical protein EON77_05615 [bacterium]|nr:MAG: hypothetical protein EON77_05615 [bacterium]
MWTAERAALDLALDRIGFLRVIVGVYRCLPCRRYFRAQPPFLRPDAVYTNRVVVAARDAVFRDGMAFSRVPDRLAREYRLRPSEATVRAWCRTHASGVELATDYAPWVAASFSGVLCVDEVYQGKLALLLAVDPRAPEGDRLVGYELVRDAVEQADIERFLERLRREGIEPDEVVTDGAAFYPGAIKSVWPRAAHQLCLFHETRSVLRTIAKVADEVRRALPKAPKTSQKTGALRHRTDPERPTSSDRDARIALVLRLGREGKTIRHIVRQTGHARNTVRSWLRGTVVPHQMRDAADAAITRLPRLTEAPFDLPPGWRDWAQVLDVRQALRASRYLALARATNLSDSERTTLDVVLNAPCAEPLRLAHGFAQSWYAIWRDEAGRRRTEEDARDRFRALRDDAQSRGVALLARVQAKMSDTRFEALCPFLREPTWEATSNGAERMARTFRHLQGPRFRLRSERSIDEILRARAVANKHTSERTGREPTFGRSARGRRPDTPSNPPPVDTIS